jgi:hypothetical protein
MSIPFALDCSVVYIDYYCQTSLSPVAGWGKYRRERYISDGGERDIRNKRKSEREREWKSHEHND